MNSDKQVANPVHLTRYSVRLTNWRGGRRTGEPVIAFVHDEVLEPEGNVVLAVHERVEVPLRTDEALEEGDEGREESTRSQRSERRFEQRFRGTGKRFHVRTVA